MLGSPILLATTAASGSSGWTSRSIWCCRAEGEFNLGVTTMDMVVSLIAWAAFGLIAGALAKFIMPGKDPGGWDLGGFVITCLLGVAGAAVGGFIGNALGLGGTEARSLLDWRSLLFAVGGALVLLAAYRAFRMLAGG